MSDHIHLILDKVSYAEEYSLEYATSLNNYFEVSDWTLRRQAPAGPHSETVTACMVDPIRCHISCIPSSTGAFEILFDTGASHSFSFDKADFISEIRPEHITVGGFLGTNAAVLGSGTVLWTVQDDASKLCTIEAEAYYVPTGGRRLFCPQRHFRNWTEQHQPLRSPGSFTSPVILAPLPTTMWNLTPGP
jgi:hypothetical protein